MPVVAVKAGIIVVSALTAAAIAVYQHPEVRQWTDRTRRDIAIALRGLSDDINPNRRNRNQQPRYNRPEDAEGFMQSGGGDGLDGDEESKKRQREELMYWNKIHLEKMESERSKTNRSGSSTFDDFLHEDKTAEKGTFVYNSGVELSENVNEGLVHRRGESSRGMTTGAAFANPFADENHIDMDEEVVQAAMAPTPTGQSETTDIYTADDLNITRESTATLVKDDTDNESEQLVDVSEPATPTSEVSEAEVYQSYMSAGEEAHPDSAFASIHAWADNSNQSFYSPLPGTPQQAPSVSTTPSEPEEVDGQLTPTDSVSLAGSGEDVAAMSEAGSHDFDVMSEDGDGIITPSSWTEVGSTVSESDGSQH